MDGPLSYQEKIDRDEVRAADRVLRIINRCAWLGAVVTLGALAYWLH